MKFLVLYHSTASARDQMKHATPEQMKAGMDAWGNWAKNAGSALSDMGGPLNDGASVDNAQQVKTSGSTARGYSIMEAASQEELVRLLKGHPHYQAPGASIEVLQVIAMK